MSVSEAQPDAIALLKADHRKVEELFEKFEKAKDSGRKRALVQQICLELEIHTRIEEEIFYPACNGEVESDLLDEGLVEHDGAKVLLAEIIKADPSEEFYDAKVKVLSEQIEHHVKEEEKYVEGIFSQARTAGLDMMALGRQLAERKRELEQELKGSSLPNPETRTFHGHKLKLGEAVEEPITV